MRAPPADACPRSVSLGADECALLDGSQRVQAAAFAVLAHLDIYAETHGTLLLPNQVKLPPYGSDDTSKCESGIGEDGGGWRLGDCWRGGDEDWQEKR